MREYTIRPYHGYDCDSSQGFNNGCYIDEIVVKAEDEYEARDKAMDTFIKVTFPAGLPKHIERDGWFGDFTLYAEGPVTDENGDLVDTEAENYEFDERKHGYTYEYISFECIED